MKFAKPYHPAPLPSSLSVRQLTAANELNAAFRLRYRIAVEKLGWVKGDPASGTETDEWDDRAYHFGAFRGDELIGYVRLVPDSAAAGIMTRKYFSQYMRRPEPPGLPTWEVADLSRLLIATERTSGRAEIMQICEQLYRLAHARSYQAGLHHWLFVTSRRELQLLRWKYRFDVRVLGSGITSDGHRNYVVYLDLRHARRVLRVLSPRRLQWFMDAAAQPLPVDDRSH